MSKRLFIIGLVWPEPDSTAAGSRMMQLIQVFKKSGFEIIFGCAAAKTDKSFSLKSLNIHTVEIELNNSSFDTLIKEMNPSIVLFDRYLTEEQYGWRVDQNCPNALKILDTEDLHFLRSSRQQSLKNDSNVVLEYFQSDITKREIASIYRCDLSLIISEYEYNLLKNVFKIDSSILYYLPFLQNEISIDKIKSYKSFDEREHFMTIGNFRHQPNADAVMHLKKNIWPLIRKKLPKAEIHVYGAYVIDKIQQLHNKKEGFLIMGWTDNLKNTFTNYKVCLAPIQFGAGLKGKLIDSMIYGTPNVTSTLGAEGMHSNHLEWNGFIEDNNENFAIKSYELYTEREKWIQSQINGVKIINQCFNKNLFEKKFIEHLLIIQKQILNHRNYNFIGSMLKHHTLKSTMYLSKWIEEKNS